MAVGSSGGHVLPAQAVAETIQTLSPESEVHFVHSGGRKPLFSQLHGQAFEIPLGGLAKGQSLKTKLKTLFQLPLAFLKACALIRKLNIEVVFGTGGAITGPVLLAGRLMGRRVALWEGNAICGLANRFLLSFSHVVFTVFERVPAVPSRKQIHSGYPLRESFKSAQYKPPKADKFHVLILGGSGGSLTLNRAVLRAICENRVWREGIFFFHQTGQKNFPLCQTEYEKAEVKEVFCFPFKAHIRQYYELSQLIFSRAGSGVIAEVSAVGRPLVLVPLSGAAGNHQVKNASALVQKNCVEWVSEAQWGAETFKSCLLALKNNEVKRETLSRAIRSNHHPDGALKIATWLLSRPEK